MSQQKSDFIITNYDNFKDASLFIKQYFEAEKRMKDIQEFFRSFYMSKLIHSEDVYKFKPKYVVFGEYDMLHSWFNIIARDDLYLDGYTLSRYKHKDELNTEKYVGELLKEISMRLRDDWACYYILDANNILHEFIPVKAADTIKITFDKESICISGYYFYGSQMTGDFGMSEEHIYKITKTIVIDPTNNNVLRVSTSDRHVSTQKIKKYMTSHDFFVHGWVNSSIDRAFDTFNYINPYKQIQQYIEDNYACYDKGYIRTKFISPGHKTYHNPAYLAKNQKELNSIYNDIIEHNKDIFMKMFGVKLTIKHLSKYKQLLWLREDAIKESYKDIDIKHIPENKFPIIVWYKCSTNKNLLEENGKENR